MSFSFCQSPEPLKLWKITFPNNHVWLSHISYAPYLNWLLYCGFSNGWELSSEEAPHLSFLNKQPDSKQINSRLLICFYTKFWWLNEWMKNETKYANRLCAVAVQFYFCTTHFNYDYFIYLDKSSSINIDYHMHVYFVWFCKATITLTS